MTGWRTAGSGHRLPTLLSSTQGYRRQWLGPDLLAGLTLLAIAVPEQLATSRLAGMPPITGLYTFIAGTVAFALLGSAPQLSVGADSTIAPLFVAGIAHIAPHRFAPLPGPGVAAGGHRGRPRDGGRAVEAGMDRRLPLRTHHHRVPRRCGSDHRRAPAHRPPCSSRRIGDNRAPRGGRGAAPRPGQRVGPRHRRGGLRHRDGGGAHRSQAPRGPRGPGGLDARRRRGRTPRPWRAGARDRGARRAACGADRPVVDVTGPGAAHRGRGGARRAQPDGRHHPRLRGPGRLRRRREPRLRRCGRRQHSGGTGRGLPRQRQPGPHGRGGLGRRPHAAGRPGRRGRCGARGTRRRVAHRRAPRHPGGDPHLRGHAPLPRGTAGIGVPVRPVGVHPRRRDVAHRGPRRRRAGNRRRRRARHPRPHPTLCPSPQLRAGQDPGNHELGATRATTTGRCRCPVWSW